MNEISKLNIELKKLQEDYKKLQKFNGKPTVVNTLKEATKMENDIMSLFINEENFLKKVYGKTKEFLKRGADYIKKNSKKFIRDIKKSYQQPKSKDKFKPGNLISMNYDAKFKNRTRWDKVPLIICLGWAKDKKLKNTHFYGLNMHHLPMKDRVAIASYFVELKNKRNGKLTYNDIKPFLFKFKNHPVLRMYIYNNVKGKVIVMPDDVYMSACAVPSEIMVNGTK